MPKMFALVLMMLLAHLNFAQETPVHPEVVFSIVNAGFEVDGNFSNAEGMILTGETPEMYSFSGSVPVKTIETGIGLRDRHLKNTDYFNATEFPEISLTSEKIRLTKSGSYPLLLQLQIKNISLPVEAQVNYSEEGKKKVFAILFQVKRSDFELGEESAILSDEVDVKVLIEI